MENYIDERIASFKKIGASDESIIKFLAIIAWPYVTNTQIELARNNSIEDFKYQILLKNKNKKKTKKRFITQNLNSENKFP